MISSARLLYLISGLYDMEEEIFDTDWGGETRDTYVLVYIKSNDLMRHAVLRNYVIGLLPNPPEQSRLNSWHSTSESSARLKAGSRCQMLGDWRLLC